MANTLKFTQMVAKEALAVAHEQLALLGTVDRQYDSAFAKRGAKIGDTLSVRSPNKYTVRSGNAMMVQDQDESVQTITLATLLGVDMSFNHVDLKLKTDEPEEVAAFTARYITPAMSTLVSNIEASAMAYYTKKTAQVAGIPGTAINSLTTPNLMRAKLNQQLAPKGLNDRAMQMDSISMAALVAGVAGYFNPPKDISEQYREGFVARTAMADFYENERVWTMQNSADIAGEINGGTLASGMNSVTVDGFTVAPNEGMVFTIEGIYDVHPETKAVYPHLKQFVASANCTTTTIYFSPALHFSTSDAKQNASGTPVDNADITFVGAASTNYVQPLMYHKDAFQFVTADLPEVDDAEKCVIKQLDGLSLRVWMASDIVNNQLLCRIDILHGYAALRPEWACRGIASANV